MTDYNPEGFVPAEEGFALPYEYTANTRAGSLPITLCIAALTPVMALANYFGLTDIALYVVIFPVLLIILRQSAYQLLVNAIHEAIRCGHADALLDQEIAAQSLEGTAEADEATLDAERFQQRVAERSASRMADTEAR